MNEHGFAAGLTAVAPSHIRPGLNAGMLLRLMLETCRTVDEALTLLHSVPVASAQTLTLADAGGAIALVECSCRRMEILRPAPHQPFVCAPNALRAWMTGRQRRAIGRCCARWAPKPPGWIFRAPWRCLREKRAFSVSMTGTAGTARCGPSCTI